MSSDYRSDHKYSYKEYLIWEEEERLELIEGVPFSMIPAPARIHQEVLFSLARQLADRLDGGPCKLYVAPFYVRFGEKNMADNEIHSVVQPDISIVCDPSKLDDKGCIGAPSFIAEIISPATARNDYIRKLNLYEKYRVREYWIVHPVDQIVIACGLNEGSQYGKPKIYSAEMNAKSMALGIEITLNKVFEID
jgi:Uma2 family endonuclease